MHPLLLSSERLPLAQSILAIAGSVSAADLLVRNDPSRIPLLRLHRFVVLTRRTMVVVKNDRLPILTNKSVTATLSVARKGKPSFSLSLLSPPPRQLLHLK